MIGRTPAYLGKQVTAEETKLVASYMLLTPLVVMSLSALAVVMKDGLAGRFGLAWLALALAGRFAAQGRQTTSAGSLPDDTVSFGALVIGTTIVVGALNFFPALALGPVVEALQR